MPWSRVPLPDHPHPIFHPELTSSYWYLKHQLELRVESRQAKNLIWIALRIANLWWKKWASDYLNNITLGVFKNWTTTEQCWTKTERQNWIQRFNCHIFIWIIILHVHEFYECRTDRHRIGHDRRYGRHDGFSFSSLYKERYRELVEVIRWLADKSVVWAKERLTIIRIALALLGRDRSEERWSQLCQSWYRWSLEFPLSIFPSCKIFSFVLNEGALSVNASI